MRPRNFWLAPLFILTMVLCPDYVRAQPGVLDSTFNPGTGVDLSVYAIAIQTNSQILIAGDFTSYDDIEKINVARVNADGSRDDTFDAGAVLGGSFPYVNAVVIQPGGKILCGGSFSNPSSTNLVRLNSNGGADNSFTAQTDDTVNALLLQTNGSLVLGGFFTHVNGRAHVGIARVGSNGGLDLGFNATLSGAFAAVYALALQDDGKILVGGSFTNINNVSRTNLARLNSDGTLDTNFQAVAMGGGQLSPAVIYAIAVDGPGRITVGGDFTSVNGQVRTNLARFASDGSLDPTFNPAAGTDFAVNALIAQDDGKLLIGGYFNTVNNSTQNYVARLTGSGYLDNGFQTGGGASDVVYALALQSDGKILIGGAFTEYTATSRNGIARLQNTIGGPPIFNPSFSNHIFKVSVETVPGKNYILEFKNNLSDVSWTALPPVPGDGTVKTLVDASATVSRRIYRVEIQ